MRKLANAERIQQLLKSLGQEARAEGRLYLVGGATAVLLGWRQTTIDVDLKFVPEQESLLRAIPFLKESLQINIELSAPDHFIPPVPGWEERSIFERKEGPLSIFHYDLYAQALAKIERSHHQDLEDLKEMFKRKLIQPDLLWESFQKIESELYLYPAIDPQSFRKAVKRILNFK